MIEFEEKKFDYSAFVVVIVAFLIVFYIVDLMFGSKSFSTLIDLENVSKKLEKRVEKLKKENAILQKEYFELKELEEG